MLHPTSRSGLSLRLNIIADCTGRCACSASTLVRTGTDQLAHLVGFAWVLPEPANGVRGRGFQLGFYQCIS